MDGEGRAQQCRPRQPIYMQPRDPCFPVPRCGVRLLSVLSLGPPALSAHLPRHLLWASELPSLSSVLPMAIWTRRSRDVAADYLSGHSGSTVALTPRPSSNGLQQHSLAVPRATAVLKKPVFSSLPGFRLEFLGPPEATSGPSASLRKSCTPSAY